MPGVPSIDLGFMGYGSKNSQSPCRLRFKYLGRLSGNGLLKVCVDISHQVKAIEVAEIYFEEAAITDTRPTQYCMRLQASMVYLLVVNCC